MESETATVSRICFIKFRLYLSLFAFLLVLGVCLSVLCFTEPGVYLPKFAFHCLWTVFALSSVSFSLDLTGPGLFHSIWAVFVLLSRAWERGCARLATAPERLCLSRAWLRVVPGYLGPHLGSGFSQFAVRRDLTQIELPGMKYYTRANFVPDMLQANQIYVRPEREGHQIPSQTQITSASAIFN